MQLNAMDERPLYLQLKEIIYADIVNGKYRVGERIPTEPELCRIYSVSRNTVRSAIEALVNENLLVKKQGKGTFVSSTKVPRVVSRASESKSFTEICRESGCVPGAKVIKSVIEDANEQDLLVFDLHKGAKVIVLERIRYTDNLPVSLEESRFPEEYRFLLQEDLNGQNSMFEILKSKYGIVFYSQTTELELSYASYEIAQYLGIECGYPLLRLYSLQYHGDKPAHISIQHILGDKFKMIL